MEVKEINEISEIFASPKRIMMLEILKSEPMGYTFIVALVKHKFNTEISSSEIYKHLKVFVKYGYVKQKGKNYFVTKKGMQATKMAEKVVKESDELPRIEMKF